MKKTVLVDDINGEEGAESLAFALDGISYEIDLIPANRLKLEEALLPFINSGRRIRLNMQANQPKYPKLTAVAPRAFDPVQVRAWAAANNVQIGDRGRIPGPVVQQYEAWQERQRQKNAEAAAPKKQA